MRTTLSILTLLMAASPAAAPPDTREGRLGARVAPSVPAASARPVPIPAVSPGDTLSTRVDSLLEAWDEPGSPGAAVAVVRDGELLHSAGYGHAQLEYDVPITPSTVFHVASVSKQFTAYAIAMLARQGELSLDDDVRRYVPEVPGFGPTVTIRHLLHHTSGLRDQWTLLSMAGWRLDDVITREDILGLVRRQSELNFEPGSEWAYSNTGYTLLAEIVARVTGVPFPKWMRDNVFEPLGMTRTHFHADHEMIVPDRAYSYAPGPQGDGYRKAVLSYANVGATSLFTTAEDLTRWAENFFEPRVGGPEVVEMMVRRGVLTSGDTISYALGLGIGEQGGLRTVSHSGGDAGFRSHLLMVPEKKFAVAVVSNAAQFNAGRTAREIAAVYLPEAFGGSEGPGAVADAGRESADGGEEDEDPPVEVARADLERVTGLYWSEDRTLLREIRLAGERLLYDRQPNPGGVTPLRPLGGDRFLMEGVDVRVTVAFEPEGRVPERMVVDVEGEPPMVALPVEPFAPSPEALEELAGEYRSEELDATYRLRVEDGRLILDHWRHGDFRLEPVRPDLYQSDAWWLGMVEFDRDDDGRVTGFRASSGRVRNLRFAAVQNPIEAESDTSR